MSTPNTSDPEVWFAYAYDAGEFFATEAEARAYVERMTALYCQAHGREPDEMAWVARIVAACIPDFDGEGRFEAAKFLGVRWHEVPPALEPAHDAPRGEGWTPAASCHISRGAP